MLEAKPQRHRDTEFAQRYFLNSPQPRRHEGTKKSRSCPATLFNAKTQRRKDAKPTHPPIWPTDHTDKHRWNHDFWLCVARSRPSNDGRVPLGRDTDSNVNVRHGVPTQRPALDERRPRHLSSSFNGWKAHTPHYNNTEERQNRRAFGTASGEKTGSDECSRSGLTGFSPATDDLLIACRSAGKKRKRLTDSAATPLRLCGSAPLRFFYCSPLVSWCLGGAKTTRHQ